VRAALESTSVDHVLVSTDDARIRVAAVKAGADAPFLRPAELSQDDTPTADAIWHAIDWWEANRPEPIAVVATLQPTSPLRSAAEIDAAIERLGDAAVDSVVSVADTGFVLSVLGLVEEGSWRSLGDRGDVRRQASPPVFRLTGGIYAARRECLRRPRILGDRTVPLIVDAASGVDIDTEPDLRRARALFKMRR
jgi:N-acylneuraminate cytidylyltransferase/CMP-N,N'-diacetyllegionaminic acid synthase